MFIIRAPLRSIFPALHHDLSYHSISMSTTAPGPAKAASEASTRESRAAFRIETAVGDRHIPGGRGVLMGLAFFAAGVWYLWLGARGLWTGEQEPGISAIQLGAGVLAMMLMYGNFRSTGWGLWLTAALLVGAGAWGAGRVAGDPASKAGWAAVAVAALCLHYLWTRRALYGHNVVIRPFETAWPASAGVMEAVTGAARRENVLVALNNAIAGAGRIRDLAPDALESVAAAAGLRLERELSDEAAWLYRTYLVGVMGDPVRQAEGHEEMAHLAALLRLPETAVKEAHAKVGAELYRARVEGATADGVLDEGEKAGLAGFQAQLALEEGAVSRIRDDAQAAMLRGVYDEVSASGTIDAAGQARLLAAIEQVGAGTVTTTLARGIYQARLRHLLGDGDLSEAERASLDALQAALRLDDAEAQLIRTVQTDGLARAAVERVTRDGRLDDAESRELAELQQRLGIDLRADLRTRKTLETARVMWQIAHGELPVIAASARLEPGEVCHAQLKASWKEWISVHRGTTRRTRTSVRHVEGFFGPYPDVDVEVTETRDVRTELRTIDTGRLLATSRRMVWVGEARTRSWSWAELLDVSLDRKELLLHRDGGDNVRFVVEEDAKLFGMIVARAMRDA